MRENYFLCNHRPKGTETMRIDFETVKRFGGIPRVHGNGFIQLDLEPGQRLHIWGHRDLPRQVVDTGIHDHVFNFTSTCIVGRVINIHYGITWPADNPDVTTHRVYQPVSREGEDTELQSTLSHCKPYVREMRLINRGEHYNHPAYEFHETITDRPSATVMVKAAPVIGAAARPRARVLVPLGHEPDNAFDRNSFPPALLWGIVHEVLGY